MEAKTDKTQLAEAIIDLFVSTIGFIPRDAVTLKTNFIHDFDIIDDDLTCFMMQVKWKYDLKPVQSDWERIETLEALVDLVLEKPGL